MKPFRRVTMCVLLGMSATASAQTLLIDRVKIERAAMPERGSTTAAVESSFGTPAEKLQPRGGQRSQWPEIARWVYPGFTVYFEDGRVIDAVAKRSHPEELGPKPPIR